MTDIIAKYRQKERRDSQLLVVACHAKPVLFTPDFPDLPEDLQEAFRAREIRLPCEGTAQVDTYCGDCEFGSVEE